MGGNASKGDKGSGSKSSNKKIVFEPYDTDREVVESVPFRTIIVVDNQPLVIGNNVDICEADAQLALQMYEQWQGLDPSEKVASSRTWKAFGMGRMTCGCETVGIQISVGMCSRACAATAAEQLSKHCWAMCAKPEADGGDNEDSKQEQPVGSDNAGGVGRLHSGATTATGRTQQPTRSIPTIVGVPTVMPIMTGSPVSSKKRDAVAAVDESIGPADNSALATDLACEIVSYRSEWKQADKTENSKEEKTEVQTKAKTKPKSKAKVKKVAADPEPFTVTVVSIEQSSDGAVETKKKKSTRKSAPKPPPIAKAAKMESKPVETESTTPPTPTAVETNGHNWKTTKVIVAHVNNCETSLAHEVQVELNDQLACESETVLEATPNTIAGPIALVPSAPTSHKPMPPASGRSGSRPTAGRVQLQAHVQ